MIMVIYKSSLYIAIVVLLALVAAVAAVVDVADVELAAAYA